MPDVVRAFVGTGLGNPPPSIWSNPTEPLRDQLR
jgi:hypothetical protein